MVTKTLVAHHELLEWLSYDPLTGEFTWLKGNARRRGNRAGTVNKKGRRSVIFRKQAYAEARLAWFYVHGVWPADQLDHADRDKLNNRLANLREATNQQNSVNRGVFRNNLLGVKGVGRRPGGRFRARIRIDNVLISLGEFDTVEEASAAYADASRRAFGEFARAA